MSCCTIDMHCLDPNLCLNQNPDFNFNSYLNPAKSFEFFRIRISNTAGVT
jgi:hypothetical protein